MQKMKSAPNGEGLGATEPQSDGPQQIEFTQNPKIFVNDETNLNDEESFYLLHSLGNMGNEGKNVYFTKDSSHNVEDPLQPQTVGDKIINKDNVLKTDDFINK
jgi:hypothetical protein